MVLLLNDNRIQMQVINERFGKSWVVCPPEHLCEFDCVLSALTFVKPAATSLSASDENASENLKQ